MIDLLTLLNAVVALLVGVLAWVFITFRTETRASLIELRAEVNPIKLDVAVIKAVQAERKETAQLLDALRSPAILPPMRD